MAATITVTILSYNEISGARLSRVLSAAGLPADYAPIAHYRDIPRSDSPSEEQILLVVADADEAGIALCAELRQALPAARIALFAETCAVAELQQAFAAGLDAVLLKSTNVGVLKIMLRLVARGEKLVPSPLIGPLAELIQSAPGRHVVERYANLTARERQILGCLVDGDSNKGIARRLNVSEGTVKVHVKGILSKLDILNRTQAAIWGLSARSRFPESPNEISIHAQP